MIRRLLLALVLLSGVAPALAQVPPPVPALPDTERRTTYSIVASLCSCNINFALYGDSTDVGNWLEVFVNGVKIAQSGNWTITSPANPGGLATAPRPITDAVLTFTAAQTGIVQIVGARRPRRASQFTTQPSARDFNQVLTDIIAQNRETWDKINDVTGRTVQAPPGETLTMLPVLANRQNMGACFDSGGNLQPCVAASGSFVAGNGITFTGTNPTTITNNISAGAGIGITGTNPLVISALPTGSPYTAPWTGSVAYTQSGVNANTVYATDFLGAKTCDGVTNVFTEMQAFLTAVSLNGTLGKSVTGIFPPGECILDSASSLTLTINASPGTTGYPINYHLTGYGSTLTPAITRATSGLIIARGTFANHGDEQTGVTVEGLSIKQHNNSNALFGFEVSGQGYVNLIGNNVYAGDDNGTHNQGNYACFYLHQKDRTDPNTGPFWNKILKNSCKGVTGQGALTGVPIGIILEGSVNAAEISGNSINQGTYGILAANPCATINANCGYTPGGVVIHGNAFEQLNVAIRHTTSVAAFTQITGWQIYGNRFEAVNQSVVDMTSITQQSPFPSSLGPNTYISSPNLVGNPNGIQFDMRDNWVGQAVINPANLVAGATATIGTVTIPNINTSWYCDVSVNGDMLGIVPSCVVASTSTITLRNTNPTSGAIDLTPMTYLARVHPTF